MMTPRKKSKSATAVALFSLCLAVLLVVPLGALLLQSRPTATGTAASGISTPDLTYPPRPKLVIPQWVFQRAFLPRQLPLPLKIVPAPTIKKIHYVPIPSETVRWVDSNIKVSDPVPSFERD